MANRPQLARYQGIQQILRRAQRTGERVSAGSLGKELGASTRTIMRDLDVLRDDHGAPLHYDLSAKTWRLEKTWTFRPIKLSEAELLQLAVAAQLARQYRGTPLEKGLDLLFRKLQQVLDEPVDIDPDFTGEHVTFFSQPARDLRPGVWETLMKAIRRGKRVRMRYQAFGYPQATSMDVDPLHLSCREGDWYLVAQRVGKDAPFLFAMSRIHAVGILPVSVELRGFDPEAFFKGSTGRWVPLHTKPVRARMRFDAEVAEFIAERTWHDEQSLTRHRDGSVTLSRLFGSTLDAKRWVLSWGSAVKVLGPKDLVAEVAGEARKIARQYR